MLQHILQTDAIYTELLQEKSLFEHALLNYLNTVVNRLWALDLVASLEVWGFKRKGMQSVLVS